MGRKDRKKWENELFEIFEEAYYLFNKFECWSARELHDPDYTLL